MNYKCNKAISAALFTSALSALVFVFIRKNKKIENEEKNSNWTTTRLNEIEQDIVQQGMQLAPINTITWIAGDHKQAGTLLKKRLNSLLCRNPWLLGRIIIKNRQGYIKYPEALPEDDDDPTLKALRDNLFVHKQVPIKNFHRSTIPEEMPKILYRNGAALGPNKELSQPLLKLAVIPCASNPNGLFAVILCVSHTVADGHTYYRVYNALMDSGEKYPTINVQRIQTTKGQLKRAVGEDACKVFLGLGSGLIMGIIFGFIYDFVMWPFCKESLKMEDNYFLVDPKKLKELKEEAVASDNSVSFVSSNDVITSWFFKKSACQHGLMVINLRDRLEKHTDDDGGNYESFLWYRQEDYRSPVLIRRSLQTLKRAKSSDSPPTLQERVCGDYFLISNWASFSMQSIGLGPNFESLLHLPLTEMKRLSSTVVVCIIFQATKDKLGVAYCGPRHRVQHLQDCPFKSDHTYAKCLDRVKQEPTVYT